MQDDQLLISLGGLGHDVGKLFERGGLLPEARSDSFYLSFCPLDSERGHPTHLHSAYTRRFCDLLEEKFDCLRSAADKSWKDWAAAHHKKEPDLPHRVIRIADQLSSQEREPGQFYTSKVNQRTLLEPVLERVALPGKRLALATAHRHRLAPCYADRDSLFAVDGKSLHLNWQERADGAIADPAAWDHLLTAPNKLLTEQYRALGNGLLAELEHIAQATPDLTLNQLLMTLTTLLERYTANVPSATNVRHPDISLFDHLRTTAAIAQALYLFQRQQGSPAAGLDDRQDPKWLLVCGDFSGIQKFIYRLTNKGAAKGLRGRSFYVQVFCRMSAEYILRRLQLSPSALLYNSGGKFYLLLPAHLRHPLLQTREKLNRWLAKRFAGEVYLGMGMTEVTGEMFSAGRMDDAWRAVHKKLGTDRLNKFKELMLQGPDFFAPDTGFDPTRSCQVCGARSDLKAAAEERLRCGVCREMERLGKELPGAEAFLTVWGKEQIERVSRRANCKPISFEDLEAALFLLPQAEHSSTHARRELAGMPIDGTLVLLNQRVGSRLADGPLPSCGVETQYLGKWDRTRQVDSHGDPWDFSDYADHSTGIKRLGVLRMDVDNLGMVFMRGLAFPQRQAITLSGSGGEPKTLEGWGAVSMNNGEIERKAMASLSRMSTLSRQLNQFFSGYVPALLEQEAFNQCQVVYAGGDDLFVIGSWHQLPQLANTIRKDFSEFCCGNESFTISGGLTLIRAGYPIYRGAGLAGEAESLAKDLRSCWGVQQTIWDKDAFCFLGVPVTWSDWELAEEVREMLTEQIAEAKNKGFLGYLREMAAGNKVQVQHLSRVRGIAVSEAWRALAYDRWRWVAAYQLRRRFGSNGRREQWAKILFVGKVGGREAQLPLYSWLELPIRWVEYLGRQREVHHD